MLASQIRGITVFDRRILTKHFVYASGQELFKMCLDKATIKTWQYRTVQPRLPFSISSVHTPASVSDFEELRLSWDGEGETRPRTEAEAPQSAPSSYTSRISNVLEL